jgi:hypothetical protein
VLAVNPEGGGVIHRQRSTLIKKLQVTDLVGNCPTWGICCQLPRCFINISNDQVE